MRVGIVADCAVQTVSVYGRFVDTRRHHNEINENNYYFLKIKIQHGKFVQRISWGCNDVILWYFKTTGLW